MNFDVNHEMGDTVLGTTLKEEVLGVTIRADMKVHSSVVLQLQRVIKFLV